METWTRLLLEYDGGLITTISEPKHIAYGCSFTCRRNRSLVQNQGHSKIQLLEIGRAKDELVYREGELRRAQELMDGRLKLNEKYEEWEEEKRDLEWKHREDKAELQQKIREARLKNIQEVMAHDYELQQLRLREMEQEQAYMFEKRFVKSGSDGY